MATPEKPETEQDILDFIESGRPARARKFQKYAQYIINYAAEIRAEAAMQPDKFTYAVGYAKEKITQLRANPNYLTDDLSDAELERMGMIGFTGQSEFQSRFLEAMVRNDENEEQMRKMFELAIAQALEVNIELSPSVKEWLHKYLRNELPAIKPTRGQPTNRKYQHQISQIVQDIIEYIELDSTRNQTSSKKSAIDAVAVAMRKLGATPSSYHRILKIWLKHGYFRISAKDLIKNFPHLKPSI
jgi:hypothetical protein